MRKSRAPSPFRWLALCFMCSGMVQTDVLLRLLQCAPTEHNCRPSGAYCLKEVGETWCISKNMFWDPVLCLRWLLHSEVHH